jgi:hypothetical protein
MGKCARIGSRSIRWRFSFRPGLLIAATVALLTPHPARAQFATSTQFLVFQPETVTTQSVLTYETQIIGLLNGSKIFDQTYAAPFADPLAQTGVTSARATITSSGGPAVVITGPTLLSHTETKIGSDSVTLYTLNGSIPQIPFISSIPGPATIAIGGLNSCNVQTLPSTTKPTCIATPNPTTVFIPAGALASVARQEVDFLIGQATTVTDTFKVFEAYELVGRTQNIGTVHTSVLSSAFDAAGGFLRRLTGADDDQPAIAAMGYASLAFASEGNEARQKASWLDRALGLSLAPPSNPRYTAWALGYGTRASTAAQESIPGDERRASGIAGGFRYSPIDSVIFGFGVDQGRTNISLDSVSESGHLDLTQFGVSGAWRAGGWNAQILALFGTGDAGTSHGDPALGGTSSASYGVNVWGASASLGYTLGFAGVRFVPLLGMDWVRVEMKPFTETGGFALTSPGESEDRTRGFVGFDLSKRWAIGSAGLELRGYARLLDALSGTARALPVAFVADPTTSSTIPGISERRFQTELGLSAALAVSPHAKVFAAYETRLTADYTMNAVSGGVKVLW